MPQWEQVQIWWNITVCKVLRVVRGSLVLVARLEECQGMFWHNPRNYSEILRARFFCISLILTKMKNSDAEKQCLFNVVLKMKNSCGCVQLKMYIRMDQDEPNIESMAV